MDFVLQLLLPKFLLNYFLFMVKLSAGREGSWL